MKHLHEVGIPCESKGYRAAIKGESVDLTLIIFVIGGPCDLVISAQNDPGIAQKTYSNRHGSAPAQPLLSRK